MRYCFVLLLLGGLQPVHACKCETSYSVCNEVGASSLVFAGTVESIEPSVLSRWNLANSPNLRLLNQAYANAKESPSAASLDALKDSYRRVIADLSPDEQLRLKAGKDAAEVESLFDSVLNRGLRVHFKVKTLFKHEDDDDDDANGEQQETEFDVWTPVGDCGSDFQPGETYLVYANNEEGSDYYFTGSCTRTKRLSDAGNELTFLFFYKNDRKRSSRIEGAATTAIHAQLDYDPFHFKPVESPVAGVVVELKSQRLTRYATSNDDGGFIFDGLSEGQYELAAFAKGYPWLSPQPLIRQSVYVRENSCAHQTLVVPKPGNP